MKNPKKIFLKRPEFPGGREAFRDYLKKHLVYPEVARNQRIEGVVHLTAQIDDNGNVGAVTVQKGIGGGCDEEAVRLIKNVQFGSVKNRGMRLKTKQRFRIEFKLPPQKVLSYTVIPTKKPAQEKQPKAAIPAYTYTIRMGE